MGDDLMRLVRFAETWEPFEGGDDLIFPEFGIRPSEFYRRLLAMLLSDTLHTAISEELHASLRRLCTRKLSAGGLAASGSHPTAQHDRHPPTSLVGKQEEKFTP